MNCEWQALHVETRSAPETDGFEANHALALAAELGASVHRVAAATVADGVCGHLGDRSASIVVMGHRAHPRWRRFWRLSLVEELRALRPDLEIHLVASPAVPRRLASLRGRGGLTQGLLVGAVAVIGTTLLALALNRLFGIRSLTLLYLFPVIAAAARWGLAPSAAAAVLSALAFNLVFLEPAFALRLSAPQTWLMAGVLISVGAYTSIVTAALRNRIWLSDRSAQESAAIAAFAQRLTRVADWQSTARAVCEQFSATFGLSVMLLREVGGRLHVEAAEPGGLELSPVDWAAVDWTWSQGEASGCGTAALTAINWQFQPLRTSLGVLAIIGVAREDGRNPIAPEQRVMFDTMIAQAALAHERLRLEDVMRGDAPAMPLQDVLLRGGNDPSPASFA